MSSETDFTVESARAAAERNEVRQWIAEFLASDGSDNAELAEQLSDPSLEWSGPTRLPFDQLHRLVGPAHHPVVDEIDEDDGDTIEGMEESIEDGWNPPPLIVSDRGDQMVVEDGNHRIEGLRRAGEKDWWALVCRGLDFEEAPEEWVEAEG